MEAVFVVDMVGDSGVILPKTFKLKYSWKALSGPMSMVVEAAQMVTQAVTQAVVAVASTTTSTTVCNAPTTTEQAPMQYSYTDLGVGKCAARSPAGCEPAFRWLPNGDCAQICGADRACWGYSKSMVSNQCVLYLQKELVKAAPADSPLTSWRQWGGCSCFVKKALPTAMVVAPPPMVVAPAQKVTQAVAAGFKLADLLRNFTKDELKTAGILGCPSTMTVLEECTGKGFWTMLGGINQGFKPPTFRADEFGQDGLWKHAPAEDDGWSGTCVAYVGTNSRTCTQFCAASGLVCVKGMDDAHHQTGALSTWQKTQTSRSGQTMNSTSCTLFPEGHSRQSTANNGCDQSWGTQICSCCAKGLC